MNSAWMMACRMWFRRHPCIVSIEARLRYRRGSKVPRTLSLSPCASPKINSEARFLLWLQMTSACVSPPDFCPSQKKPIKKTNSCGPSVSSGSAPPRQAGKQRMRHSVENLSTEEMEEYTFSLQWVSPLIIPPQPRQHSKHEEKKRNMGDNW